MVVNREVDFKNLIAAVALVEKSHDFFSGKKISGLEWGLNPHLHISGVMLYQLSYQALGSKVVGRKSIQVLVLGAHYFRTNHAYILSFLFPMFRGLQVG